MVNKYDEDIVSTTKCLRSRVCVDFRTLQKASHSGQESRSTKDQQLGGNTRMSVSQVDCNLIPISPIWLFLTKPKSASIAFDSFTIAAASGTFDKITSNNSKKTQHTTIKTVN